MAVRLGVAPIAWSNDDLPELGGDTPLGSSMVRLKWVIFLLCRSVVGVKGAVNVGRLHEGRSI